MTLTTTATRTKPTWSLYGNRTDVNLRTSCCRHPIRRHPHCRTPPTSPTLLPKRPALVRIQSPPYVGPIRPTVTTTHTDISATNFIWFDFFFQISVYITCFFLITRTFHFRLDSGFFSHVTDGSSPVCPLSIPFKYFSYAPYLLRLIHRNFSRRSTV